MPPRNRRKRGTGALYCIKDDAGRVIQWRAAVDLGFTPDGKRRRKVVSSTSRNTVIRRLNELRQQVADGRMVATASPTVEQWMQTWLDDIAARRIRPRTLDTYRGYVAAHIVPSLGRRKLDAVQPQHIRAMHTAMTSAGKSPTTVRQAHAILTRAFADARREGHTCIDVSDRMERPRAAASTRDAMTPEEAIMLLRFTHGTPLGPRWATALFLGARQGECLGLEWDRVDFAGGSINLSWQLQRLRPSHGCGGTCGKKRPSACPKSTLTMPPGFEVRATSTPGLYLTRPKSRAGKRRVPMLPALAGMLASLPGERSGLVFTDGGKPIDPRKDSAAWHDALKAAGLPSVPLHTARHTAATLLRAAGADDRTRWQILGHASAGSADAYLHEDDTLAREAMTRVGGMLALD